MWIKIRVARTRRQHVFTALVVSAIIMVVVVTRWILIYWNTTPEFARFTYNLNKYEHIHYESLSVSAVRFATYTSRHDGGAYEDVGEITRFDITLLDINRKPMSTGGDIVRLWLVEPSQNASVTVEVIDLNNGMYYAKLLKPWSGKPTLHIDVAHTKEQIAAYAGAIKSRGSDIFSSAAQTNVLTEETIIIPPGKQDVSKKTHQTVVKTELIVKEGPFLVQNLLSPEISCKTVNARDTWTTRNPSGYMYKNEWNSCICMNELRRLPSTYRKCLKNRHVYLIGDFNMKAWFLHLTNDLHMTIVESSAHNSSKNNMASHWMKSEDTTSGLAFFYVRESAHLQTIVKTLDSLPVVSNAIVVMSLCGDIPPCCNYESYSGYVRQVNLALQRLLNRTTNTKLFIQGALALYNRWIHIPLDFAKDFEDAVIFSEFLHLRDKLYYLDGWSMSVGDQYRTNESTSISIREQIHNMIGYVC